MKNLTLVSQKIRRASDVYLRFYRLVLTVFKWRLVVPPLFGAIGISLQVTTISLVLFYAKHINTGEPLSAYGFSFHTRQTPEFIIAFGACCMILLILSAISTYLYNLTSVKMSLDFERHLLKRGTEFINSATTLDIPVIDGCEGFAAAHRILVGDSRYLGRAFLIFIQSIIPLITCTLGAAVLLRTNWRITLGMTPLFGIYAMMMFRVNSRGINFSRDMEATGLKMRQTSQDLLLGDSQFEDEEHNVGKYLNAYGEVILLPHRSALINDLLMAVALTGILTTLASSALALNQGWEVIVVYLVALRYTVNYLKATIGRFTIFNRFLPYLRRYLNFFISAEIHIPQNTIPNTIRLSNGVSRIAVQPSETIILYYPHRLTKFNVLHTLKTFISPRDLQSIKSSIHIFDENVPFNPEDGTITIQKCDSVTGNFFPSQPQHLTSSTKFRIIHSTDLTIIPPVRSSIAIVVNAENKILYFGDLVGIKENLTVIAESFRPLNSDDSGSPIDTNLDQEVTDLD